MPRAGCRGIGAGGGLIPANWPRTARMLNDMKTNGKPKKPRKRRKDARVADFAEGVKASQRTIRRKMKRIDQILGLAVLFREAGRVSPRVPPESIAKLFCDLAVNVSDADLAAIAKLPAELQFSVAERLWKCDKPTGAELLAEIGAPKPTKAERLIADIARFHTDSTPEELAEFQGKALARGIVVGTDDTDERTAEIGELAEEMPDRFVGAVEALDLLRRCGVMLVERPENRFEAFVSPHGEHHSVFRPIAENDAEPDESGPETGEPESETAAIRPQSEPDDPDDRIAEWIEEGNSTAPASRELVGAEPA